MASVTASQAPLGGSFEQFLLPPSMESERRSELADPSVAICLQEFVYRFASHRVPSESGLERSRRHARFFRRGRRRTSPASLHPAVWELLRDVGAAVELAVDVHLRELSHSTPPPYDLPSVTTVSSMHLQDRYPNS